VAVETLEDRAVPSSFGGLFGSSISSVPAQDARLVSQEFQKFVLAYNGAVSNDLLSATPNTTQFNKDVNTALTNLFNSIQGDIKNLSTASTLGTTINGQLLGTGTGSTSLEATLDNLAATAPPTASNFRSVRTFLRQSLSAINRTASTVVQQVRSAPAPAGSISSQTVQTVLSAVRSSFQTFSQTYSSDVRTVLLSSGTTNRTAFDAAIGTAPGTPASGTPLATLNAGVASAVSTLPSSVTSTLTTTLQNDLLTGGSTSGNSLQARLAAIPSPTGTGFLSTGLFRIRSGLVIGSGEARVVSDILSAVKQFNASLSG